MPSTSRSEQITALYARDHDRLQRIVTGQATAPRATIEDACQTAWTILLRRPDITLDHHGFAWLVRIAIHAAWELASTRRETPLGILALDVPEQTDSRHDEEDLAERLATSEEQRADLAQLKPRERRELFLQALGYTMAEIATATGSSYTAVNRRLSEGRAHLRRLAAEREEGWGAN